MRIFQAYVLLIFLAIVSSVGLTYCQEIPDVESPRVNEPVEILERIEDVINLGHNYRECYRTYFASASVDDILKNRFSNSPSFSAQCAWRSIGASSATRQEDGQPLDMSLVWFIGFVEGRAAIDIPVWWEEFLFAKGARGGLPWGVEGIRDPPKISFEGIPENIRKQFEKDLNGNWHSFAFTKGQGRIVIARYTELGVDGNLWCFDIDSERLLWMRRGPECKAAGVAGGPVDFHVSLAIAGNEVLLAGAGCSYTLHAFNVETGATRFLFCSLN